MEFVVIFLLFFVILVPYNLDLPAAVSFKDVKKNASYLGNRSQLMDPPTISFQDLKNLTPLSWFQPDGGSYLCIEYVPTSDVIPISYDPLLISSSFGEKEEDGEEQQQPPQQQQEQPPPQPPVNQPEQPKPEQPDQNDADEVADAAGGEDGGEDGGEAGGEGDDDGEQGEEGEEEEEEEEDDQGEEDDEPEDHDRGDEEGHAPNETADSFCRLDDPKIYRDTRMKSKFNRSRNH